MPEACQSQDGFKGLLSILSLLSDPSLLHPPLPESLGSSPLLCCVYSNCCMRIPDNFRDASLVHLHGRLWLSGFERAPWGKGQGILKTRTARGSAVGEETPRDRDGRVSSDSGTPAVTRITTVTEQRNRGDKTGRGLSGFRAKPVAVRCRGRCMEAGHIH